MTVFKTARGRALWVKEGDRDVEPYIDDFPADPKPMSVGQPENRDVDVDHEFARMVLLGTGIAGVFGAVVFIAFGLWIASMTVVWPRDLDGRYAQVSPEIRVWFNGLSSGRGNCCSMADGRTITDAETDIRGGHFWVLVDNEWIEVPDEALVKSPNRIGPPVVWPMKDGAGKTAIRCFLAGAGA